MSSTDVLATPVPAVAEPPDSAPRTWGVPRHPALPVIAASLALLALARLGADGAGLVAAFTLAVLTVLSAVDLEHRILPNVVVLPAFAVVLVMQLAFHPGDALQWIGAAVAAAGFLAAPRLVSRQSVGMGDVKLGLLLGAALGWGVFGAIVIGCLAIVPVALVLLARGQEKVRKTHVPFGPFLALGALVTFLGA